MPCDSDLPGVICIGFTRKRGVLETGVGSQTFGWADHKDKYHQLLSNFTKIVWIKIVLQWYEVRKECGKDSKKKFGWTATNKESSH